jgi:hypothetical protein
MSIKVPLEPTMWENVKHHFMTHKEEWAMESEDLGKEISFWLAQTHNCSIRGRKHLYFVFENEYDAEVFLLKFSAKNNY